MYLTDTKWVFNIQRIQLINKSLTKAEKTNSSDNKNNNNSKRNTKVRPWQTFNLTHKI